jgi:hypothetical protein
MQELPQKPTNLLSDEISRGELTPAVLFEAEKSGELADFIRNLDLSNKEDVRRLLAIAEIYTNCGSTHKFILNRDGTMLFPKGNIETKLTHVLELTDILEKLDSCSLADMRQYNGHSIVKIPIENLSHWADRYNQMEILDIISSINPNNSNQLLSTLIVTSEVAAQSINRYDTGMFIGSLIRFTEENGLVPEEVLLNHPNGQTIRALIKVQKEMFTVWNDVCLKYLSNIIKNQDFYFSVESQKLSLEVLTNYATEIKSKKYRMIAESLLEKIEKSIKENTLCTEIETETGELINKMKIFTSVLEDYNSKMEYARPENNG